MRLPIEIEGILFKRIDGKIWYLLLKRRPEKGEFWQPVTGGLEEGETKTETLRREIREETGIENIIKIIEDVHYYEFQAPSLIEYFKRHGRACNHVKEYVFGVEVSSEARIILDEREHSEFKWCSLQEALRLMKWKGDKEALKKLDRILRHI
jgi:8-oxo-dGTP pyrophosphatase MutT (NUDIX family)